MKLTPQQQHTIKKLQDELLEMHQQGAIELDKWPTATSFIWSIEITDESPKPASYWSSLAALGEEVIE